MKRRTVLVRNSRAVAGLAALTFTLGLTCVAEADVTRIVITRVESPTFEGVSFGAVGQYEKLVGRAFGEVDPNDHLPSVTCRITRSQFKPRIFLIRRSL